MACWRELLAGSATQQATSTCEEKEEQDMRPPRTSHSNGIPDTVRNIWAGRSNNRKYKVTWILGGGILVFCLLLYEKHYWEEGIYFLFICKSSIFKVLLDLLVRFFYLPVKPLLWLFTTFHKVHFYARYPDSF